MKSVQILYSIPAVSLFAASAVHAQDPAEEVEAAVPQAMSLMDIIQTGGWPMIALGVMSVIGLAFVLYFFITLRQGRILPPNLIHDLRTSLMKGNMEAARRRVASDSSPAASIASVAMEYAGESSDPNPGLLKELIEGEGGRQAVLIQNQTQYLMDIAVISPMIGLLGTVIGMLGAFNAVASDIAQARPMMLAAGVSQALITTAAGLIVGIPAMMFYAYFRGRTNRIVSHMESFSADLLTMIAHQSDLKS